MSLLDSPVEIRQNSIQLSIETEFCEFSPELEDHFEILEHIRGFNVTIMRLYHRGAAFCKKMRGKVSKMSEKRDIRDHKRRLLAAKYGDESNLNL
ncbi:60S ribosomal protein L5, mitochondrial [Linum perenne]